MGFRVTDSILFRTTLSNVARQRANLANTQEQAASGLRINKPSDDPVGIRSATLLRNALDVTAQYDRNIVQGRTRLSAIESSLGNVNELLVRLRELTQQGANDALQGSREEIAVEVEALHARLLQEANSRVTGGYLFSGYAVQTEPFSVTGTFNPTGEGSPAVAFDGDTNEIQTAIDQGVAVRTTLNGERVFMGDSDGDGNVDSGREDLFDLFTEVRDALMSGNDTATARLGNSIDRIDTALEQVSRERTLNGATETRLIRHQEILLDRELQLQTNLSGVQDADAAEVFSDLVRQEAALEASLQATSRVLTPTLLNFIG